jgi:hypothetical protein
VGGVYGNPRPLRTPSATSPRDGGHSPPCHHSASIASASVSVGCCSRARLILEIDISKLLSVVVAHDETLNQRPHLWHSRAGGGAVHSIKTRLMRRSNLPPLLQVLTNFRAWCRLRKKTPTVRTRSGLEQPR